MITKLKWFSCLLVINAILGSPISMFTDVYAQGLESSLNWKIEASKEIYYPGEPILLTLNISNTENQKVEINFGADGIEAFSIEIRDPLNKVVAQRGKIRRPGVSRSGVLTISPGETTPKLVILNQWCSTQLTPGRYHVVCRVEYRFPSEKRKYPNTKIPKVGPIHTVELGLEIQIVSASSPELKAILEGLAKRAFKKDPNTTEELADREIARKMLAFTESALAVPYQLRLLENNISTWLKWDVIDSLTKSKSLDAASGLVKFIGDPVGKDDVKRQVIEAIYKLRETGKADILNATSNFVAKYKRPFLTKPVD